jgi:hypothetical protein
VIVPLVKQVHTCLTWEVLNVILVVPANSVALDNLVVLLVVQVRSLLRELPSVSYVLLGVILVVVNLFVTIVPWVLIPIKVLLNVLCVLWVNTKLVMVNLPVCLVVLVKWLINWVWLYVSTVVKVNTLRLQVVVSAVALVPMLMVLPILCVLIANLENSPVVVPLVVELVVLVKLLTRKLLSVTVVLLVSTLLLVLVLVPVVKVVTIPMSRNKRNVLLVLLVNILYLVLLYVLLVMLVNTLVPLVPVLVVCVMLETLLVLLAMPSVLLVLQVLLQIKQVLLYVPSVLLDLSHLINPPTLHVPSVLLDNTIASIVPHNVQLALLVSLPRV